MFPLFQVPKRCLTTIARCMIKHKIVPCVIKFAPRDTMEIIYPWDKRAANGNFLTPKETENRPCVYYCGEECSYYSFLMTELDTCPPKDPQFKEIKHWMILNIPGTNMDQGEVYAEYLPPVPTEKPKCHRYLFLLYKQPTKINFREIPVTNYESRLNFSTQYFASTYLLGIPEAGNFFFEKRTEDVCALEQKYQIVRS